MREECITPHHYGAAAVARLSWRTLHSPRLPCVGERQRCAPCSAQQKPWLQHPLRRRLAPSQHNGTISAKKMLRCLRKTAAALHVLSQR